jgi:hypothetical protein
MNKKMCIAYCGSHIWEFGKDWNWNAANLSFSALGVAINSRFWGRLHCITFSLGHIDDANGRMDMIHMNSSSSRLEKPIRSQ